MNRFFYFKLAVTNIKKNAKTYVPYIITSILTICMFYIICSLSKNPDLTKATGTGTMSEVLFLGTIVCGIFAVIFLFYTNSFLMKRRKKEFGLYNILGMEKKHISRVVLCETLIISVISLIFGILVGILFDKLMLLVLLSMFSVKIPLGFYISSASLNSTFILFAGIFLLIFLNSIRQIHLAKPIELLQGGTVGEKEPKAKWFIALLGFICLGTGYYIAVTTTNPIAALMLFFVAVILVIIGTYLLFTAGSIVLLKALRKNKNYYYKTKHFISVSGMIYRMKQNAVGLANICILCTCVLVTLSSTICLYKGIQDSIKRQFYMDGTITVTDSDYPDQVYEDVKGLLKNKKYDSLYTLSYYNYTGSLKKNKVHLNDYDYNHLASINLISLEDYNHYFNQNLSLNNNEAYLYSYEGYNNPTISLENIPYTIKGQIKNRQLQANNCFAPNNISIVINQSALNNYKLKSKSYFIGFNASKKVVDEVTTAIIHKDYNFLGNKYYVCIQNSYVDIDVIYELYGSLLFIGIFLSMMFLVAAIVIIYNKQISEGFEDQNKFEILQNVGMSQNEVKQTIQFQVLIFFFVPLIVAIIHLAFAYPLILLILKGLQCNDNVYLISTTGCIAGLIIIYTIVYLMTSKAYYRIVKG